MNKIIHFWVLPLICLALALTCSCRGVTTIIIPNTNTAPTDTAPTNTAPTNTTYPADPDDNYQPPSSSWHLSWSDEFNVSAIDSNTWTHELGQHGWGNSELQNYTSSRENSYISNGKLVIEAKYLGGSATARGNYTSARMISENKFSFKYGLVVARMKAPYGRGLWPAIWMLGGQDDNDVGWPYDWPQCGEIDIFEMFGDGGSEDRETTGAMHWYSTNSVRNGCFSAYGEHRGCGYHLNTGSRLADDFHYYSLEWNENQLKWRFDGQTFATVDISDEEFDEFRVTNFFLLLNVAVGGNPVDDPDTSVFPQTMTIDWIRVYTNSSTNDSVSIGGARKIFADAASVADVEQLAVGEIIKDNDPGGTGGSGFTLTYPTTDGADGSSNYLTFTENSANAAGHWSIFFWKLPAAYNMEKVSNTVFSFYVRSADVSTVAAKIEDTARRHSEIIKTFTADNTWQRVEWSTSDFVGDINLQFIDTIVIVPKVGETDNALTMDFDELQFIEP